MNIPVVEALRTNLFPSQVVPLSSLFTVSGLGPTDTITSYQLSEEGPQAGEFFFATPTVADLNLLFQLQIGQTIEITQQQLDRISYQAFAGTASETFTIAASVDDIEFSLPSTNFISSGNTPPRVEAVPSAVGINQRISFNELFVGEDVESEIDFFRIRDNGVRQVNGQDVSGFFVFQGQRLAANTFHVIDFEDIGQLSYQGAGLASSETFTIQASDGILTSPLTTQGIATGNTRPVVTPRANRVIAEQRIPAAELFNFNDADGDEIVSLFIADQNNSFDSGFFELNGVAQPADQVFQIAGNELPGLFFVGAENGPAIDTIRIQAFDGSTFSTVTQVQATTSAPPVITGSNLPITAGTSVNASQLFNVFDADGDTPQVFFFVDRSSNADGGFFVLDGVRQESGRFFRVSADQLGDLVYQSADTSQFEQVGVQIFDGFEFSEITDITVGSTSSPIVTGTDGSVRPFALIDVAPLVDFTDPDGQPAVSFRIRDQFQSGNTGRFELDGSIFPQGTTFEVTAAELERLQYRGGAFGSFTESITIQGSDGQALSALSTFNITTVQNAEAPDVVPQNLNALIGSVIDARSLFTASDAGGDPIETVSFIDTGVGSINNAGVFVDNTGFFTIDGVRQPAGQTIEVDFELINEGRVQYQVASIALQERFLIGAFDGTNRSSLVTGISNSIVRPTVEVIENDLSFGTLERQPIASLLNVAGANAVRFQVFDENSATESGRLELDGAFLPQGVLHTLTAAEFNRLQVVGAIVDQGRQLDPILVRAENTQSGFSEFVRINVNTDPGLSFNRLEERSGEGISRFRGEAEGDPTIITYSFLDGGNQNANFNRGQPLLSSALPIYLASGFPSPPFQNGIGNEAEQTRALNAFQRESIREGLELVETFANVNFVEVPYENTGSEAQIVYGAFNFTRATGGAIPGTVTVNGPTAVQVDPATVPFTSTLFSANAVIPTLDDAGNQIFVEVFDENGNPAFNPVLDAAGNPTFTTVNNGFGNPVIFSVFDPDADPTTFVSGNPLFPAGDNALITPVVTVANDPAGNPIGTANLFTPQFDQFGNAVLDENGVQELIPYTFTSIPVTDAAGNPVLDAMGLQLFTPVVNPRFSLAFDGRSGSGSDVFFDINDVDPNSFTATDAGGQFFTSVLSSTLTALGVNNPNDLSIFADFDTNTLFSAGNQFNNPLPVFNNNLGLNSPASLPLYDVAVLQALYGANEDFNTDNNQYRFNTPLRQTLFDGGGSDAINFTTSTVDESIDLRQGTFSTILGIDNALRISYGTVIENARGGSGDDLFQGNETANFLFGNGGDDTFIGAGGNDVLRGGNGDDIYQWNFGDGRDLIIEQNTLVNTVTQPNLVESNVDILEVRDPTGSLDSLADDLTFRRFGDDLRIDLTFNQGPGQGTVTIRDFAETNSQVERLRLFNSAGLQISEVDLTSIFDFANTQPQRFQVTGTRLVNEGTANQAVISIATPV